MSTTETGRHAEAAAAAYLVRQGCQIIAQNWRTRRCEIDIVAERHGTVYLCEVKYRRTARQGRGLDYVTPQKVRQMTFAAHVWVAQRGWSGAYELCAIEVSGPAFRVTGVIRDF